MITRPKPYKQYNCIHFLSLLHKYHDRRTIQQIHSHLITSGLSIHHSSTKTPLTIWNSLLRHYALGPFPIEALLLYKHHRQHQPILSDSFTYSFLIKSCANLQELETGFQFHGVTIRAGFGHHVYVQTALVNMYVECGALLEAKKLFDEMPEKNSVSWNVLITGLIRWGGVDLSRSLFDMMPAKNVVSWTGIIDGYTRMNRPSEALSLFRTMVVQEGMKPTEVTLLAIFPAIWNLRCLQYCQTIHTFSEKSGFLSSDIRVTNSLIDAYAKCGCVRSALRVFEDLSDDRRNVVSWTSLVSCLALHGMGEEAVDKFRKMEDAGVLPNQITFLSVLNACSHSGLVEEGLLFFRKMVDEFHIEPNIKHYGCLIDILGRAGRLEEAEGIALEIPEKDVNAVIWRTLLGACSFYGNVQMGERITRKLMEMDRGYGGDYVLLSNIFAGVGRYADSGRVRTVMDERSAFKVPGLSAV